MRIACPPRAGAGRARSARCRSPARTRSRRRLRAGRRERGDRQVRDAPTRSSRRPCRRGVGVGRGRQRAASRRASSSSAAADRRHPKGTPTKVDVVSRRAAIRRCRSPTPADARPTRRARRRTVRPRWSSASRWGRGWRCRRSTSAWSSDPAKKDEGGAGLAGRRRREGHAPPKQQMAQLPPGMDKEIASLQGTAAARQGHARRQGERRR